MQSITRKTLLYRGGFKSTDYCLNHVEGCSHGCKYPCYAFLIKQRHGAVKDYADWIKPKLVSNALDLLDSEMNRLGNRLGRVYMSFATDIFMYGNAEVRELTLRIMAKLNSRGVPCTTLTKGLYPKEVAEKQGAGRENHYGITLVSLDEDFRKKYEPGAAPLAERLAALKYLHDKGCKTWVSLEPYPPEFMVKQDITKLLDAVSFVDEIAVGKLNYNNELYRHKGINEFYKHVYFSIWRYCDKNKISYAIPIVPEKKPAEEPVAKAAPQQLAFNLPEPVGCGV